MRRGEARRGEARRGRVVSKSVTASLSRACGRDLALTRVGRRRTLDGLVAKEALPDLGHRHDHDRACISFHDGSEFESVPGWWRWAVMLRPHVRTVGSG